MLADRTSRCRVIAAALAVWSGVHRAVRDRDRASGNCSSSALASGVGEAGGRRAVLCADRRLFPAQATRARAGHLFAGRAARAGRGTLFGAYLALWSIGARRSSSWASPASCSPRSCSWSSAIRPAPVDEDRARRRAARAALPMIAAQAELLADGLRRRRAARCAATAWPSGSPRSSSAASGSTLIERGQFLASILLIGGTAGVFGGGWLATASACRPRAGMRGCRRSPG